MSPAPNISLLHFVPLLGTFWSFHFGTPHPLIHACGCRNRSRRVKSFLGEMLHYLITVETDKFTQLLLLHHSVTSDLLAYCGATFFDNWNLSRSFGVDSSNHSNATLHNSILNQTRLLYRKERFKMTARFYSI